MRPYHRLSGLILFSLLGILISTAGVSITQIPTMSQLPEKAIKCMLRDSEGYMWYGTDNGLCRDDGYRVTVFHSGIDKSVNGVAEDSVGRIWVSTDKGAWALDKRNFTTLVLDSERIGPRVVQSIHVTADGDIWVNQKGRLRRYDKELNWKRDYPITDRYGVDTHVSGFCQARTGEIYMASYSRGVYRYDPGSDSFIMSHPIAADVPLGHIIQDHKRDYFWMRDFRGSLYRFDPMSAENTFTASNSRPYNSHAQYYENLYDMAQDDKDGYIWGISRNFLMVFKPEPDGRLTPINLPVLDRYAGKMMSSLLSTPGAMWIGCLDSGSEILFLNDKNMIPYELPALIQTENAPPVVSTVTPATEEGLLWMLQDRRGLLLYDVNRDKVSYHDSYPDMLRLRLRMAEEMASSPALGGVWVSQERSRVVYAITHRDMNLQLADSVVIDNLVNPTVIVTALLEDSRGRLWVGTTDGLFGYDLHNRDFVAIFPQLGHISAILETPDKKIFALSKEQGLYSVIGNKKTGVLPRDRQVHKGSSLALAPDGNIWMGTDDGLVFCYNPDDDSIEERHLSTGNSHYGVKQISFSHDGHGWIVNDSRIVEFSTNSDRHFIYQSSADIPLFRFKSVCSPADDNSETIVCGAGGVVLLRSNAMIDVNSTDARVVVSDIVVDGRSKLFEDNDYSSESGSLLLEPDDRNIEIFFSALDYHHPSKTRYAYRIDGYDRDWLYTQPGENRAFYNSLPKGHYTLQVKYIDEYNRIAADATELIIRRKPHLWETWWAYTLYFLFLAAVVGAIIYYNLHRVNARNEEMWSDSEEMIKMRSYLQSPVTLPEEEFQKLDKILLDKATKAVEANMDDPEFDVNSLASSVNMSRSTLARKLKSITGKTPLDFIREIKMQHACSLLRSKNYTIGQIAEMLGFSDRRYFTACFRKEMGITPRDYQARNTPGSDSETDSQE